MPSHSTGRISSIALATCVSSAMAQIQPFDDGQGRQWRHLTDLTNLTWEQVAQVCPPDGGPCSGTLRGIDVTGLRWASQQDVLELFALTVPEIEPSGFVEGPGYVLQGLGFLSGTFRPTWEYYTTFGGYLYIAGWCRDTTLNEAGVVASASAQYPVFYGHFSVLGEEATNVPLRFGGVWLYTRTACDADLSGSSDPSDPAYGTADGIVDSADFFYYLDQFVAGDLAEADLTGSSDPNDPAYGMPDGAIDAADFFYFLDLITRGC